MERDTESIDRDAGILGFGHVAPGAVDQKAGHAVVVARHLEQFEAPHAPAREGLAIHDEHVARLNAADRGHDAEVVARGALDGERRAHHRDRGQHQGPHLGRTGVHASHQVAEAGDVGRAQLCHAGGIGRRGVRLNQERRNGPLPAAIGGRSGHGGFRIKVQICCGSLPLSEALFYLESDDY
ncbi:hypothetical protein D9M72_551340 [compost metagenome]